MAHRIPFELVFNPNWWFRTANISFDLPFYMDMDARIQNDVSMRRVLFERYGSMGLGEEHPQPRPVIGSLFVAGGFIIPALFGCDILFDNASAPQPKPLNLSLDQIESLQKLDFLHLWPMQPLIAQMDQLQDRFGYLVGDWNTDGLLNVAYHLYGQELFSDFISSPNRVTRLLSLIGELITEIALYFRQRTGSCSISVNHMVSQVDPALFLHGNCSVPMISPRSYRDLQLPVEIEMSRRLHPYGIHHCGSSMEKYAPYYAHLNASFFDVGWGSDISLCRKLLPDAFLNLRLSPIRMLTCTSDEIAADTSRLLESAGQLDQIGICCINLDYGTPDENIFAMYQVVDEYQHRN